MSISKDKTAIEYLFRDGEFVDIDPRTRDKLFDWFLGDEGDTYTNVAVCIKGVSKIKADEFEAHRARQKGGV